VNFIVKSYKHPLEFTIIAYYKSDKWKIKYRFYNYILFNNYRLCKISWLTNMRFSCENNRNIRTLVFKKLLYSFSVTYVRKM